MRPWLSLAAAVAGSALLAAAGLARSDEPFELRVEATVLYALDPAYVDSYDPGAREILYATCAKLVNNPDVDGPGGTAVVAEVARALPTVSPDGRVYTFVLRTGSSAYRFNTGELVTAESFVRAIERNVKVQRFSTLLENLAGAEAHGARLVVRLKRPMPEAVAHFARAEFCAVPPGTPFPGAGLPALPGAGPYYVASSTADLILLRRNPHYHGMRPRHATRILVNTSGRDADAIERAETGFADYVTGDFSADVESHLQRAYGVNRSQFFVQPELSVGYLVLNAHRPLFRKNPSLRRAVNFAIDRHAIAAARPPFRVRRSGQILPPLMPGYHALGVYPIGGPDFATARRLARGHTRGGEVRLEHHGCGRGYPRALVDILTYDLAQIGLRLVVSCKVTAEGSDIGSWGAGADVGDPGAFLEQVFRRSEGCRCQAFLEPRYRRRLERLRRRGPQAYDEIGALANEIMRDSAPVVPLTVSTREYFVAASMTNVLYNPLHGVDLGALRVR